MGKPYSSELNRIQSTISHAQDIDPTPIRNYLERNISRPFLIIGSGGSFSVAQIIAMVINKMGGVAQAVTPYEILEHAESMRSLNAVFFSAGGGNPDILSAYTFCKRMETHSTFVFCLTENSKLVQLAKDDSCNCDLFVYDLPGGKDGFLAVNSTVFAVTILQRVLSDKPINHCLPSNLPREIDDCIQENAIIALGGRWTLPAVADFESKCIEAGLVNVMPADLRNFAHGRHHWLAKHPDTSIICFVTNDEFELAQKTIRLLPNTIHKCIIKTDYEGIDATQEILLYVFQIVKRIGDLRHIDPGKPGVPRYGSQIYRINHRLYIEAENSGLINRSIISRMTRRKQAVIGSRDLKEISDAAEHFLSLLSTVYFKAIVIDYDNTIISRNCSDDHVFRDCIEYINKFLQNEIGICFATGRGKSIRQQLLQYLLPDHIEKVYVSYYNGAFILPLSAELPPVTDAITPELIAASSFLKNNLPSDICKETIRNECLTYEGTTVQVDTIYKIIASAIIRGELPNIRITRSDHSVDITPKSISKGNARIFMQNQYGNEVLCIGDAGDECGNDYDLLNYEYSLSADRVSTSLISCWNIASLGLKGPTATKEYLGKLLIRKKGLHFSTEYLRIN